MHIRCPHCHSPIELVSDDSFSEVTCPTCGSSFSLIIGESTASHSSTKDRTLAHFQLLQQVGVGHFGVVWKARDTTLDRIVALKIPRRDQLSSAEQEYFFRDARAAAQLEHPGIVSVHEIGRDGETIFIASQFIDGANLSEWFKVHRLTPRESAQLMISIAEAVHQAHARGVIHRDLKPGNILMDLDGVPHVADFGLAKRESGEITMTVDGQILGTPAYMSPEQARGKAHEADARSDVYALGVILYELLTGELPFRGERQMLLAQIQRDEPPKPRTLKASVPRDLQTVCLKCLEKAPLRRYATAAELADDLRRYVLGEPIKARPITQVGRVYRWCRRQPAVAALSASLLIALAVGILGVSRLAIRAAEGRANLYHRMVRQVQAGRMLATEGYVPRAWQDLQVARSINTPELDLDVLRQEAVACLGDVRGYDPISILSADRSITVCSLHPRGKLLAIGHHDGRIELYDPASGAAIFSIAGQGASIAALTFADAGNRLLFVDTSRRVFECVVETAKPLTSPLSAREVFQVDRDHEMFEFVQGGQYLVAHSKKSAAVWETASRSRILQVPAPEDREFKSVRVSPDGKWLAASYNTSIASASDRLMLWNVTTGELEKDIPLDRGHGYKNSLAFGHDSKLIAFGGEGLGVYRVPALDPYSFYRGDAIKAVTFSPDDQLLALVQIRGTVALWRMAANTKTASLSHPRAPNAKPFDESVEYSADGQFLVSAKADSARVWNLRGARERVELAGHDGGVPTLMFSPDGRRLASGGKDQTVRIWDLTAGTLVRPTLELGGPVQGLAFSPDERWLATADLSTGDAFTPTLHVWNANGFASKNAIPHRLGNEQGNLVYAVAFSPNGKYLAACGSGMQLWRVEKTDSANGQIRLTEVAHSPGVQSLFVQFSPDSRLLAWADNWFNVRIWDIVAAKEIPCDAKMHIGWHGFAFVGEDLLAFVGPHLSVEVWDVRRGRQQFTLGQPGEFSSPHIAATADGAYLVGANTSESVAMWDVRARKKLFVFRPERNEIWSLAFNPAGTKLAVGLSDGGMAVWDLSVVNRALAELDLAWMNSDDKE